MTSHVEMLTRQLLRWYLPDVAFSYNIRPTNMPGAKSWQKAQYRQYGFDLQGLEVDIYADKLKMGWEVQGEQHGRPIEHFANGNLQVFLDQQQRDAHKDDLCRQQGVTLDRLDKFNLTRARFEPFIRNLMTQLGRYEQFRRTSPPIALYAEAERLSRAKFGIPKHKRPEHRLRSALILILSALIVIVGLMSLLGILW